MTARRAVRSDPNLQASLTAAGRDPADGRQLPCDGSWSSFHTRQPDEARKFLMSNHRAREVRMMGDLASFEFSLRSRHLELFSVDLLRHSGQIAMIGGRDDDVHALEVVHGRLQVNTAAGRLTLEAGSAVMTAVDDEPEVTWDDVSLVVVHLDALELRQLAAELAGVDPAALHFRLSHAVTPAHARQWSAAVRYVVHGVLENPAAAASPLARRECFRLLAATALETFPQADFSLTGSRAGDPRPAPATIRRAVEFIEANAHRDITVVDIAQAARLSIRGTQAAFQRHLDTSPAAYLRRVRLAGAHRDLVAADPTAGEGVAEIAARWGFLHLGHFAAGYRERYGVLPSHTLAH
jgi:AraC-like DNA-binding protein